VPDIKKGCGPLGGIHSGLSCSQDEYNFFFACDMPFLNQGLINYMIKESPEYDVTIPLSSRGYETLHAVYSRRCLPHIENLLREGNFKILDFFPDVKMKVIDEEIIKGFDPEGNSFFNVNTKEDYLKAKDLLFDSHGR
jgi:molybdopterin-guanine dinucleotide biosynthesis protein A